ncbi:MAG: hypothetical protein CMF80_05855 [Candidatus Marinimicrobia bacterium]|nr:hypothetical protein [Candidatus Neomarinimicrobiota bacterium]
MANYQQSNDVLRIYNARTNILKQLEIQGYNIETYNEFSINEVHIMNNNKQNDMLLTHSNGEKIYVKFYLSKSLRPQNIHDMIEDLFNLEQILTEKDTLMIITRDRSSRDTLVSEMKQLYAENNIYLSIIDIAALQFNIIDHKMVPRHIKLTPEQVAEFKKQYNIIDDSYIPEISRFDPAAVAIGLKPGEICKILRTSKTAIYSPYYRICINN